MLSRLSSTTTSTSSSSSYVDALLTPSSQSHCFFNFSSFAFFPQRVFLRQFLLTLTLLFKCERTQTKENAGIFARGNTHPSFSTNCCAPCTNIHMESKWCCFSKLFHVYVLYDGFSWDSKLRVEIFVGDEETGDRSVRFSSNEKWRKEKRKTREKEEEAIFQQQKQRHANETVVRVACHMNA